MGFKITALLHNGQLRLNTRQHFFPIQRLGDVIRATDGKAFDPTVGIRQGTHENDRDVRQMWNVLEPLAHLKTVDAWHHHIQQNQIRLLFLRQFQCIFTTGGDAQLQFGAGQIADQNIEVLWLIIDDQNACCCHWGIPSCIRRCDRFNSMMYKRL